MNFSNLQVSSAVLAVFLSASDVLGSFPRYGFFRPTYDSCQYVWVLCNAGGHDSWRIYYIQRSSFSLGVLKLSPLPHEYSFSYLISQIAYQAGGFGVTGFLL